MENAINSNAFRVLSIAADTEMKDVYRQQQRLQNGLELGDTDSLLSYKFLHPLPLDPEILLDAVHRLEKRRLLEEVFWIHDLGGKIDLKFKDQDAVLRLLRADANLNTSRGVIARHNLAVILTLLGLENSSEHAFDRWHEAFTLWARTFGNRLFWEFLQDRADYALSAGSVLDIADLQTQAKKIIQKLVKEKLWAAINGKDYTTIAWLTQLAIAHAGLLNGGAVVTEISGQLIKEGSTRLGSIADRIAEIKVNNEQSGKRAILVSVEADVRSTYEGTAKILGALQATSAYCRWSDLKAVFLGRLSVAYHNVLEDTNEWLRLVAEARQCAYGPDTWQRLERDSRYVQCSLLCSDAITLINNGDFAQAQQRLAGASSVATEEQREEVENLQEVCRRSRVFHGVDANKKSPTLQTINGIGATFYGKRDYDHATSTYVTTHWFVFFFVPIIPMGAYRVAEAGPNSYHIHGQVQLSPFLKKWRWAVPCGILLLIIIATLDFGANSSSTLPTNSGYSIPASSSSDMPSSISSSPPPHQNPTFLTNQGSFSSAERRAIEAERAELQRMSDSLDAQERELDGETAALKEMRFYLESVSSRYTRETIPEEVRLQYNATLRDFKERAAKYKINLDSFNSNVQERRRRATALQARIDRYNANR